MIRVLLGGNSLLKNQGICSTLLEANDLAIIGSTTELEQLPESCSSYQPDLLLIVFDGWEDLLLPILYRLPLTNILVLLHQNEQGCPALIRNNIIAGCLPETTSP